MSLEELWPDPHKREVALDRLEHRLRWDEALSPIEVRVLRAVSHGLGREGAADVLGLTLESVKFHLKHASQKLRAKNTTHACCEALRQGLIE